MLLLDRSVKDEFEFPSPYHFSPGSVLSNGPAPVGKSLESLTPFP